LAADRKAWTTPACISMSAQVELEVKFLAHGMVGGYGTERFGAGNTFTFEKAKNPYVYDVKANCFPLNTMLDAIGVGRVDMFSLDVEGAELQVLETIDFDRVSIGLFIIEHNGAAEAIHALLVPKGYRRVESIDGQNGRWKASDVMYVLESEFPAHAH
jgi:Methyltransferase FkbM domain